MKSDDLQQSLAHLKAQGLYRTRRVIHSPQGPTLNADGVNYLSFCSNDYLGLANHPDIIEASICAARTYGVGAAASALVCGHTQAHEALEEELARFVGMPRALYFSNGYMANIGTIAALVGAGDTIFLDRLSHASLIDGARLSGASLKIYPHNDIERLERLLAKCQSPHKLVATDAVFSMDGDICPLAELTAICERYGAWLLVDDAHGFGVLGPEGRGSLRHASLNSDGLIYMGTLGKAAGVAGAFVAGPNDMVEWLMQRARTYMFTTANSAAMAAAVTASLSIIQRDEWRRTRLTESAAYLRQQLAGLPWQLLPSSTAIQPLIVGDNLQARALMDFLRGRGIWVPAICPPTVPKGTARLRISLCASHTPQHLEQLSQALLHAAATLPQVAT